MRADPYKNYKFRVLIDGVISVGGFTRVSGLSQDTEVIPYREGGDNGSTRKLIGPTDYSPIVLEKGLTYGLELQLWAMAINTVLMGDTIAIPEQLIKQNVTIQLLGKTTVGLGGPQQVVKTWVVYRCWPSHYEVSEMNAMSSGIMVESIVLQNEGWVQI